MPSKHKFSVVVGLVTLTLYLEGNSSLKEKRRVVKSLLGKVKSRFNTSASELGYQDDYEMAMVGFSVCGSDTVTLRTVLQHILNYATEAADAEILDSSTIVPIYADEEIYQQQQWDMEEEHFFKEPVEGALDNLQSELLKSDLENGGE
jgi:uncharacterized protein YlxP (DUF503 family)